MDEKSDGREATRYKQGYCPFCGLLNYRGAITCLLVAFALMWMPWKFMFRDEFWEDLADIVFYLALGVLPSVLVIVGLVKKRRWAFFLTLAQDALVVILCSWAVIDIYEYGRTSWIGMDVPVLIIYLAGMVMFLGEGLWIVLKARPYWTRSSATSCDHGN